LLWIVPPATRREVSPDMRVDAVVSKPTLPKEKVSADIFATVII